jgi:hypothetical protein
MKNLHPARKRLLLGFLLLAATFFYAFAPTCGLIGQFVHFASSRLLGQTGSTLVALVMLGVGLMLVIPHGAVRSAARWVWHGREARVAGVVRELDAHVRGEFSPAQRREMLRILSEVRQNLPIDKRALVPVLPGEPPPTKLAPAERMKLDAVRGALKELGYKKYEFEPIVAGLDPTLSDEVLVRDAVKQLHAGSN